MADTAVPPSEALASENVEEDESPAVPPPPSFPPYPPYAVDPVPPSLADTIKAGRDIRVYHKAGLPRKPVRPAPRPAKPRSPKATDVKLTKRALCAHARCLRRHNAVLTDRLEYISKPYKRKIISVWRDYGHMLPADTIARLRNMLDADEPFKPDQAYEYFINLRKTKKQATAMRFNEVKKDVMAMCADKRYVWARNATVVFARGIQRRLARPGRYALADGMLRLSNIILKEISAYMHMKPPSRRSTDPKAKFMMEMSDKVAIWIDDILAESDDRMLMMDFDEDADVINADNSDGFTDDFLDMTGGAGGRGQTERGGKGGRSGQGAQGKRHEREHAPTRPAYEKLSGPMAEAFKTLTNEMDKKGDTPFIKHGKFKQNFKEAANQLKKAKVLDVEAMNRPLVQQLNKELTNIAKPVTPEHLETPMNKMVDMVANYLTQEAEFNKDKGDAFKLIVEKMKAKGKEPLYQRDNTRRTYAEAAKELEDARNGLEATHDDPNLSQEIGGKLAQTVDKDTPPDKQQEMKETVDIVSKYLSEKAVDEGIQAAGGVVTDDGFYIDENGVKRQISSNNVADNFYIDEDGIRRKKKPGEETYVDAQGITRKKEPGDVTYVDDKGITRKIKPPGAEVSVIEEGLYVDENGVKKKINSEDAAKDFYVDDNGIRKKKEPGEDTYVDAQGVTRKKKHGEEIYVDAQGIARKGKPPGAGTPITEEGFYVDENGVKNKIDPKDDAKDFYVDDNGIRRKKSSGGETYIDAQGITRKKKLGEETYVDAQGFPRKSKSPGTAASVTEEGFYVDENGVKKKISAGDASKEFYVDENGIRRKKKPGEETYIDAQGVARRKKSGVETYVDEQGITRKKEPGEKTYVDAQGVTRRKKSGVESYVGAQGITRKKESGEETYVDAQGVTRRKKSGVETYVDAQGITKIKEPGEETYIDAQGITRKKEPGEETYVDTQGVTRRKKSGVETYVDAQGIKSKKELGEETYVNAQGVTRKINSGEDTYVDAQGITRKGKPPGTAASVTEEGFYVDENGVKKEINTENVADDFYVDESGIKKIKKPGDHTYVDAQGIRRKGKPAEAAGGGPVRSTGEGGIVKPGAVHDRLVESGETGATAAGRARSESKSQVTEEGYYIDEKGNKKKIQPGDNPDDFYLDATGKRKKKISGGGDEEAHKAKMRKKRDIADDGSSVEESVKDADPDRAAALNILHNELKSKGSATLYRHPHTELTYGQASKWLKKKRMRVDKSVKESGDTTRLYKKFERKLDELVFKKTPERLHDAMQDVVIESSRVLSEYFVAKNYKAIVTDGLISEMQKKGNEILVEVGDASETYFFAAQRLKKAKSLDTNEPCDRVAYFLTKQLEDLIRSRSVARKVIATMKEHIKDASDYLSEHVTKPDEQIEAYVALLGEMESKGDALLIEGNIPKSYKSCADYLRTLTSFEDQICRPNPTLKSSTESKLKSIMAHVTPRGYTTSALNHVISETAGLLVSYIMLQGEKTEALKILTDQLTEAGPAVLLRHGIIRKTFADGADILRGKNADQLSVSSADPVVARKIQLKLLALMQDNTPDIHEKLMDDVIEDATKYLANYLLQPRSIKVCQCMKNEVVQCELWSEEILRHVARPRCTCSRHVPARESDVLPREVAGGSSVELVFRPCPPGACSAPRRAPACASYAMYPAVYTAELAHGSRRESESFSEASHSSGELPESDAVALHWRSLRSKLLTQTTRHTFSFPSSDSPDNTIAGDRSTTRSALFSASSSRSPWYPHSHSSPPSPPRRHGPCRRVDGAE